MTTRGIQLLKQKGIAHKVVKYDHDEKGAQFAARAVDFPLPQTIKTLVVHLDNGPYALVLMPGDKQLSMKKLAKALNAKRAAMADEADAQRLTGYQVGGISPFGTKKQLPVAMDAGLQTYETVMINAGRRGMMVQLAPADMVRILKPVEAELCEISSKG